MKVIIEMEITKVKNAFTGDMVQITEEISKDAMFKKATAKNIEIICKELEKNFKKKGIITKFNYYFDDGK